MNLEIILNVIVAIIIYNLVTRSSYILLKKLVNKLEQIQERFENCEK